MISDLVRFLNWKDENMRLRVNSTKQTKEFYHKLMTGNISRNLLGTDKRFNADQITGSTNIKRYFVELVEPHISPEDHVLDLGCGTGGFSLLLSEMCSDLVSVDIVEEFVTATNSLLNANGRRKATVLLQEEDKIPTESDKFDAVILIDVIHHLENPNTVFEEVKRVLRRNGKLIIFEPNKLNPLLYLMHLLDRNEWGLLKLGRPSIYRQKLAPYFEITEHAFNGMVIGPESIVFQKIANFLSHPKIYPWLGWLLPKIFLIGTKKG